MKANSGIAERLRDTIRWWPLLLATTVVALGAAWWSHEHAVPTYVATTKVVVVPLPQWDETFLGTDLVRDSGDATRTAATAAVELQSDRYVRATADYLGGDWSVDSVADSVKVLAPDETNIIEITARSADPDKAEKLSSGYATAMMADRWQRISAQLDSRIAALSSGSLMAAGDPQGTNPTASEQAARLRTITTVRESQADPTLRVGMTSPPERIAQLPLAAVLLLAGFGGLVVGVLAAAAFNHLRSRKDRPMAASPLAASPIAAPMAFSRHGFRTEPGSGRVDRGRVDVTSR